MGSNKKTENKYLKIKFKDLSEPVRKELTEFTQRASESLSCIDKEIIHNHAEVVHSGAEKLLRIKINCLHHYASFLERKSTIENIFKKHKSSISYGKKRLTFSNLFE